MLGLMKINDGSLWIYNIYTYLYMDIYGDLMEKDN